MVQSWPARLWVKERQEWWGAVRGAKRLSTVDPSPLIFVPSRAIDRYRRFMYWLPLLSTVVVASSGVVATSSPTARGGHGTALFEI
jgi:hypothetical protein